MPQITIYLPRDVAERIKKKAKTLHKSLSAYLTELARKDILTSRWPKHFINLYGSTQGELSEPERTNPEERQKI